MPASESMEVDTSPPFELQVIREVDFRKGIRLLDQMDSRRPSSRIVAKC